MLRCRSMVCLAAVLALAGTVRAQTVELKEEPLRDNFFRVNLTMKLTGKTTFQQEGKFFDQPLAAEAQHEFLEKILDARSLDAGGFVGDRAARIYKQGQATITFNNRKSQRSFRPDRTFLVAQRQEHSVLMYSPRGSLTREELELTEHFNTLVLTGLVPGKEVKVGEAWKAPREVVQALCGLEALISHEVECKLDSANEQKAEVTVLGSVKGIDLGCSVSIGIQANYTFDLKDKRIVAARWKQNDQREQGPASPAMSAEVVITVERSSIAEPQELNATFLNGTIPPGSTPPVEMTLVRAEEPKGRFTLQHTRDWILTAQSNHHTVLRLMKQGALVAQATLTPWPKLEPGQMEKYAAFVDEMKKTPTWEEEGRITKEEEQNVDLPGGYKGYRYAASGKLDERDVVQYFYLLAGPHGDQMVITFTMNPNQVKDLGVRDLDFVRNITFPTLEVAAPTPAVPASAVEEKK